jgi:hypothetical protein
MKSSSTELYQLLTTANCSLRTSLLGGSHGKHHLLLSRIVSGLFTDPLSNNRRPIVARVGSRGNVFIESLPSNRSIHTICYVLFYHGSLKVIIRVTRTLQLGVSLKLEFRIVNPKIWNVKSNWCYFFHWLCSPLGHWPMIFSVSWSFYRR